MWRRINLAIDGFLVGMLFEYTLRVEVSILPIGLGIVILIGIILDIWLFNLKDTKTKTLADINVNLKKVIDGEEKLKRLPKPWMVQDAGQDIIHMLWYVQIVHFDDITNKVKEPRQIYVEEGDSYEEVLSVAISLIKVVDIKKV